jgi:hypothetical protein
MRKPAIPYAAAVADAMTVRPVAAASADAMAPIAYPSI